MALQSPTGALHSGGMVLPSPASLLPSPLDKFGFASQQGPCSPGFAPVKEGRLSFDNILVHDNESQESSQDDVLECFRLEREPLQRARSAAQIELFAMGSGKTEAATTLAEAGAQVSMAAKLAHKQATPTGTEQQGIPAIWNEGELLSRASSAATQVPVPLAMEASLDISFGAAAKQGAGPAGTSETASGMDEEATSALKAQQAVPCLDTAEDVRPRLVGTKREFDGSSRMPSFSFPVLGAAAASTDGLRRQTRYDRMRELEAQVQQLRQIGDALQQAVRRADFQHTAALSENQQLWALVAHLAACLRAGHSAQKMAAQALAAPEDGSPDLLLAPLFSPDDSDLAAACGMFISPAKAMQPAATNNKPRKLFQEEGRPNSCTDIERCGAVDLQAYVPAPHVF